MSMQSHISPQTVVFQTHFRPQNYRERDSVALRIAGRDLVAFTFGPRPGFDSRLVPNRLCDERPIAALVAARYPNIQHVQLSWADISLAEAMAQAARASDRPMPNPFNLFWSSALWAALRQRGISTLLTGGGGNFTISNTGLGALGGLLREGRFRDWAAAAAGLRGNGAPWRRILGPTLVSLFPRFRRPFYQMAAQHQVGLLAGSAINAQFARETGILDRARAAEFRPQDGRARRLLSLDRTEAGRGLQAAAVNRLRGFVPVDVPLDRRVIEFCLAIPEEQFMQGGQPSGLIRHAMAGLLPPELLAERRRGLQQADWPDALNTARADIAQEISRLEASPLAQRCLDLPRLRRLIDDWPTGGWHHPKIRANYQHVLGTGLAMGRFLRGMEEGSV